MESPVLTLGWIAIIFAGLVGIVAIPLGLPGQYFLTAGALVAWLLPLGQAPPPFSGGEIVAMFLVGALADLAETISGIIGGKKAGGSRRAAIGALVGGIAGAIAGTLILPLVGSLIGVLLGTFLGAAVGEWSVERKKEHSARVGLGALIGRLIGILLKGAVATGLLAWAMIRLGGDIFS